MDVNAIAKPGSFYLLTQSNQPLQLNIEPQETLSSLNRSDINVTKKDDADVESNICSILQHQLDIEEQVLSSSDIKLPDEYDNFCEVINSHKETLRRNQYSVIS